MSKLIIQKLTFKSMSFGLLVIMILAPFCLQAQNFEPVTELPSPKSAFLKSLVLPGWGHHYVDNSSWTRGQFHLAAETVMILSYVGLTVRGNYLENELETFASSKAQIDLSNKDREFQLAVANFDNLDEYNDFQLRTRNWDNLLTDIPENQWNWNEDANRFQYQDMRERVDRNESQLPTILTLMVANRLVSGLSAYNRARSLIKNAPEASFSYLNEFGEPGVTARLRFAF